MQTAIVIAIIIAAAFFAIRRMVRSVSGKEASCGCSGCSGCSGPTVYSGGRSNDIPPRDASPRNSPDACSSCPGS